MSNLDDAIAQIEKQFGKGTIMRLGGKMLEGVESSPTGSIRLDKALGIGGIPKGRVTEIYGPESSGKTTLALHLIAEVQKAGGTAAFVDAEHALDPKYAQNIGVNVDELLISQPDNGEQALEILDTLIRSGQVSIIVVDSVAALTPLSEIEGDMGQSHMGLQARLMSQALRKIAGITAKTNCIVVFINQLRQKLGIAYGNPETTTGGNALKFYASVRIDIRRIDKIKEQENIIGNKVKIKIVKNKVAPPFKEVETAILYGIGLDWGGEILDTLVEKGCIEKAGAWFKYKEERMQGRPAAVQYVRDHEKEMKELL